MDEPPAESIPITIHVRTDWRQERFVEVMKKLFEGHFIRSAQGKGSYYCRTAILS